MIPMIPMRLKLPIIRQNFWTRLMCQEHNLQLKVGPTIIMLRNLNHPKLCNSTRLSVKKLMNNLILAKIIKGKFKGEEVLIPRIPIDVLINSSEFSSPFDWLLRWQSINRKGNLWKSVGLISDFPVFRMVSYTLPVSVLANRVRCLFLRRKINQKILCIKTLFTDLGFK